MIEKMHVEAQLREFTSAITPVKEEITRTQSEITALEQKQEELDETIGNLEDQLALLKAQRQEVASSLTTARDEIAVAEAKVESNVCKYELSEPTIFCNIGLAKCNAARTSFPG